LAVTQQSFQWVHYPAQDFVGFDFTIVNIGVASVDNVYIGMFADCDIPAVGNGAGDDMVGYFEGMVMASDGTYVPVNIGYMYDGSVNPVPSYFGVVLCGHTIDPTGQTAPPTWQVRTFQRFQGQAPFSQGGDPTNDSERYELLSESYNDFNSLPGQENDYRFVISSGPFTELAPGDSLVYQVAMVAGDGLAGLLQNAAEAVLTYYGATFDRDGDPGNGDEFIVRWLRHENIPVAAASGVLQAEVTGRAVRLECQTNLDSVDDLVVERAAAAGVPQRIWEAADFTEVCHTSTGVKLVVEDTDDAGWPRTYTFSLRSAQGDVRLDQVELTSPQSSALNLTVYPNPFNPQVEIHCAIPQAGPVQVRIFDARGRLIRTLYAGNLASGDEVLIWRGDDDTGRAVASGVYHVHLQTARHLTRRSITLLR
jgi:hypothetical protein